MNLILAVIAATALGGLPTGTNGVVRVTSDSAFYDNKEGYAYLNGHVFVDDADCQLHADRAYVFTEGTNGLKRVVALGHVALTNGTKRAYGEKASYYRKSGLVVLNAGEGAPAEVRDEAEGGAQVVRGKKIKYWVPTKQVEVQEAWIAAPRGNMSKSGVKDLLGN